MALDPKTAASLWQAVALGNPGDAFWRAALAPLIATVAANPPSPERLAAVVAEVKAEHQPRPVQANYSYLGTNIPPRRLA